MFKNRKINIFISLGIWLSDNKIETNRSFRKKRQAKRSPLKPRKRRRSAFGRLFDCRNFSDKAASRPLELDTMFRALGWAEANLFSRRPQDTPRRQGLCIPRPKAYQGKRLKNNSPLKFDFKWCRTASTAYWARPDSCEDRLLKTSASRSCPERPAVVCWQNLPDMVNSTFSMFELLKSPRGTFCHAKT